MSENIEDLEVTETEGADVVGGMQDPQPVHPLVPTIEGDLAPDVTKIKQAIGGEGAIHPVR